MRRTGRKKGKNRITLYLNDENIDEKIIADLLFDDKLVYDKNKFIKGLILNYIKGTDLNTNPTIAEKTEKIVIGDIKDEVIDDLAEF